jgi:hypothetical protein
VRNHVVQLIPTLSVHSDDPPERRNQELQWLSKDINRSREQPLRQEQVTDVPTLGALPIVLSTQGKGLASLLDIRLDKGTSELNILSAAYVG